MKPTEFTEEDIRIIVDSANRMPIANQNTLLYMMEHSYQDAKENKADHLGAECECMTWVRYVTVNIDNF